jgi:hypothetical protein
MPYVPSWIRARLTDRLGARRTATFHLVILDKEPFDRVGDMKKRWEARLSAVRCPPHGGGPCEPQRGDVILFREEGASSYRLAARITTVDRFEKGGGGLWPPPTSKLDCTTEAYVHARLKGGSRKGTNRATPSYATFVRFSHPIPDRIR